MLQSIGTGTLIPSFTAVAKAFICPCVFPNAPKIESLEAIVVFDPTVKPFNKVDKTSLSDVIPTKNAVPEVSVTYILILVSVVPLTKYTAFSAKGAAGNDVTFIGL